MRELVACAGRDTFEHVIWRKGTKTSPENTTTTASAVSKTAWELRAANMRAGHVLGGVGSSQ